jgi:TolB-like protein
MGQGAGHYCLRVCGAFRLDRPDGQRIAVNSKRGQALIAMLATAPAGERTRSWLQSRLWGSRGEVQAQASLRRELSTLRQLVNGAGCALMGADHQRVWLDLDLVEIDLHTSDPPAMGEFLEGMDLAGEESFEDWLRDERSRIAENLPAERTPRSGTTGISLNSFGLQPALAVLPFACGESDEAAQAMAQGLSEDLIDRLSRLRWLPVIARSSSFAVSEQAVDACSAGVALGARYVVEGTLRPVTNGHILSAVLIDAEDGKTLWSSRQAINVDDDQLLHDELLDAIAATLGLSVDQIEQQRAIRRPQAGLSTRDLIWKGRWHLNRLGNDDIDQAKAYFAEALTREPSSPEALIQTAWVRVWELWLTRGSDEDIREVRRMAQQAIIADYEDARGHMLAGIAEIWLKQPLRAEALLRRAIELNPSLVMAHSQLGCALHLKGEHLAAIETLNLAVRLSPNDHDLFFTFGELAAAYLFCRQFDDALDYAEQSLARRSAYWLAHVVKINALVELGRGNDALIALGELKSAQTGFRTAFIDWLPFLDSGKRNFLKEGLNRASRQTDE